MDSLITCDYVCDLILLTSRTVNIISIVGSNQRNLEYNNVRNLERNV